MDIDHLSLKYQAFQQQGFTIFEQVLSEAKLIKLEEQLQCIEVRKAGTRNLLNEDWCVSLAQFLMELPRIKNLLPTLPVAVQCTYFNKSLTQNWAVAPHRDRFIPVKHRIEHPSWTAWTEKEGITFVQPPESVLGSLVAVRLHLENNTKQNGPLVVQPSSHRMDNLESQSVACLVSKGDAVILKPLLVHSSPKLKEGHRRVIHFLFGPHKLPNGVQWNLAVCNSNSL